MPKPLVILVGTVLIMAPWGQAQVPAWKATYDGQGSGVDAGMSVVPCPDGGFVTVGTAGHAMAVLKYSASGKTLWQKTVQPPPNSYAYFLFKARPDSIGNVIIISCLAVDSSDIDFSIFKISADGRLMWTRMFDGGSKLRDFVHDLDIDHNGNAYVTGEALISPNNSEFVTLKYSPDGSLQWERRFNRTGPGAYGGRTLKLTSDGQLYVAGVGPRNAVSSSCIILLYDSLGNLQWSKEYLGPGNLSSGNLVLSVDENGNAYVAGSANFAGYADLLVVKYSIKGDVIWATPYGTPGPVNDTLQASVADAHGDVYLAARCHTPYGWGYKLDYLVVKMTTDGNVAWARRYDGPTNGNDTPSCIAVSGDGCVYVSGVTNTYEGRNDYGTVKYSATGDLVWARHYSNDQYSDDYANSICVASNGHVVVTGQSKGTYSEDDIATVAYSPDGTQEWVNRFDSTGGQPDYARIVDADAGNNIIAAGSSYGYQTGNNGVVIKYSPVGQQMWIHRRDVPNSYFGAIAPISDGNLLVAGTALGAAEITKLSQTGVVEWVASYQLPDSSYTASDIAIGSLGDFYVVLDGIHYEPLEQRSSVVRFDHNGTMLWVRDIGTTSQLTYSPSLALAPSGDIVLLQMYSDVSSSGYYLRGLDADGHERWVTTYVEPEYSHSQTILALDSLGRPHVALESGGGFTVVLYDSSGQQIWQSRYIDPINQNATLSDSVVDAEGNTLVTGTVADQSTGYDCLTLRYDVNGSLDWVTRYDGVDHRDEWARSMTIDRAGSVYVAVLAYLGNTDYRDGLLLKYDAKGKLAWAQQYDSGDESGDSPMAIAVDGNGDISVAGYGYRLQTGNDFLVIKYYNCPQRGDANRDGVVNGLDIQVFIDALIGNRPLDPSPCALDENSRRVFDQIETDQFITTLLYE